MLSVSCVWEFLNYWYYRYLLVTELYMVEKWERAMFHILFFIAFAAVFIFNTTVTAGMVSWVQDYLLGEANSIHSTLLENSIKS